MKKLFHRLSKVNWKYVFGELLLIVFGILIALYISNFNEARKLKIFERNIVAEIEKSLTSDFEFHIENRIERGNQIMSSAEFVLNYLDGEMEYHDSLETHFWRMNWIMIFEPQTIPFERLKAKGIEILSDEEVRLKLLELYDFTYPSISYFTEDYNTWSTNRIEPYCLQHFEFKSLARGKGYQPIDKEFLSTSIEYRNLVLEKKSRTKSLIGRMSLAKRKVEELLGQLKK